MKKTGRGKLVRWKILKKIPINLILELGLLCGLLITLVLVPPDLSPVAPWNEISLLLLLRGFIWLFTLSILPGLYVLRLVRIEGLFSNIGKLAVSINLSLVLVGLASLVLYYSTGNISQLSWFVLVTLIILGSVHWAKTGLHSLTVISRPSRLDLLLFVAIISNIIIALSVQVSQTYLVAGDVWVSLTPAVQIESQRNVYEAFASFHYPLMFGFILAGLSICSGLPVVNAHILLFPLTGLNILTFYVLIRRCFNANKSVATLSTFLYSFTGGFGWLVQRFAFGGMEDFWTVSYLTQDMYFTAQFWNGIMFYYKSLALTLGFAFILIFVAATKLRASKKIITMSLASLFILFSFYTHMLELVIFIPVALVFSYILDKKRCYLNSGLFLLITVLFAFLIDTLTGGYYSWLTNYKITAVLPDVDIKVFFFSLLCVGVVSITVFFRQFIFKHLRRPHIPTKFPAKGIMIIPLIIIYLSGPYFVINTHPATSIQTLTPLPWYYHTTRYGFVGLLALIGIAAAKWGERWFKVAFFWCILTLSIGSIWWSARMSGYMFPMVALFAAVGIKTTCEKAGAFLHITITTATNTIKGNLKLNLKSITVSFVIILLALSVTSPLYGAGVYITSGPSLTDDTVRVLKWISRNTPQNAVVLVPNTYNIYKSINTIADRRIYLDTNLPTTVDAASFTNLTQILQTNSIQYALTTENITQQNYLVALLLAHSIVAFKSGENRVYKLPHLTPPMPYSNIAVIDKETLGLSDTTNFEWYDDSFTSNWTYRNVNATTDGEVLTCKWNFYANNTQESSIKTKILPTSANEYPYLIISYRNTPETTSTAENNVGQIITLINATGYPKGSFKNIYLPIKKQQSFNVLATKLPENQNIAEIWIWMRNYQRLSGAVGLQIDYIGLATTYDIAANPLDTRFLSLIMPALWTTGYSIVDNPIETTNAPIIVATYDKSISPSFISDHNYTQAFVLFNETVTVPLWGTEWKSICTGLTIGYVDDKEIILCETKDIDAENMTVIAEIVYQQIQQWSP